MKKKKNALLIILAAVVAMLAMSVNVWAAQKNPLAQMSTKYVPILFMGLRFPLFLKKSFIE